MPARKTGRKSPRQRTPRAPLPKGVEILLTAAGEPFTLVVTAEVATSLFTLFADKVLGHHLEDRILLLRGLTLDSEETRVMATTISVSLGSMTKVRMCDLLRQPLRLRKALRDHCDLQIYSNAEQIGFHIRHRQDKEDKQ